MTDTVTESEKPCILVTGGAGFIGSHTCVELLNAGYDVVVVDDLSNASEVALKRVERITGKKVRAFYQGDVKDGALLDRIFDEQPICGAIHFAAYKAVGESVHKPIEYYQNNLGGTLELARALRDHGVYDIVFSSSATVYGQPDHVPVREDSELKPATNPYGRTKTMNEQMLRDLYTLVTGHMPAPEKAIRLSRIFLVLVIALALLFALTSNDIISYITKMISMIMSGMFICTMLGRFWTRFNWQGAVAALAGGAGASVAVLVDSDWLAFWGNPCIPAVLTSLVASVVVTLLTPASSMSREQALEMITRERESRPTPPPLPIGKRHTSRG